MAASRRGVQTVLLIITLFYSLFYHVKEPTEGHFNLWMEESGNVKKLFGFGSNIVYETFICHTRVE